MLLDHSNIVRQTDVWLSLSDLFIPFAHRQEPHTDCSFVPSLPFTRVPRLCRVHSVRVGCSAGNVSTAGQSTTCGRHGQPPASAGRRQQWNSRYKAGIEMHENLFSTIDRSDNLLVNVQGDVVTCEAEGRVSSSSTSGNFSH